MKTQRRFEVMGEDIYKITEKLLSNQNLLRLIKITDNNPLDKNVHPDITQEEADEMLHKNILVTPKIFDDHDDNDCFVIVLLDDFALDPMNQDFKFTIVRFDIICPLNRWVTNERSLRPYLMMQEIDKMFNEQKLAGIGNLSFMRAKRLVVSSYLGGYSMNYGHYEFN